MTLTSRIRMRSMPSSRRAQAVMAEVLSQAIGSGMNIIEALDATADAIGESRMRRILQGVAISVNAGETLANSFQFARFRLHPDLRAAMEVGEERGRLDVELAAAARRLDPLVAKHTAAAIGRRAPARHFAASLARLLAENPLNLVVVMDAVRLVGPQDRRFARIVKPLLDDIEGGSSLDDAMACHPSVFDRLLVRCVARTDNRATLRRVLSRVGEVGQC